MSRELYFLRSSEQKIVTDMFALAHPDKKDDSDAFEKYTAFYGLSSKDMGLYILQDGQIAGAIWARKFQDDRHATLSLALVNEEKCEGAKSAMMEQFLLEAASAWELLRVDLSAQESLKSFYESFGFVEQEKNIFYKKLIKQEVVRPSDGYDPRKWMD